MGEDEDEEEGKDEVLQQRHDIDARVARAALRWVTTHQARLGAWQWWVMWGHRIAMIIQSLAMWPTPLPELKD